jgi:hypothetical protein
MLRFGGEQLGELEMPPPHGVVAGALGMAALLGGATGKVRAVVDHHVPSPDGWPLRHASGERPAAKS